MTYRIPVSRPDITVLEEKYAAEAVRSSWISSTGPFLEHAADEFVRICSANPYVEAQVVLTCNGTAALHLALLALDVRPGDEVIVPSLAYVAVANACRYVGAEPVFVDVDPYSWCIDPVRVQGAITPRTKGIIAVHNYGHPADMDAINHIAEVYGLWVVEDAAEAHFATYNNKPVGALADIGVFSFYGNKIITSGEGGACVTRNEKLAARMRLLRGQGMDPSRRYFFPVVGRNFRMTNVAAAILCAQLERRNEIARERRRVFARYESHLLPKSLCRSTLLSDAPWLFCALFPNGDDRDEVAQALAERDIETRPFFIPIHMLPPYRECRRDRAMVHAQSLAKRGLNLPTYPGLKDEEIDEICSIILETI